MPQAKTKSRPAPKKRAATPKRPATRKPPEAPSVVERTSELSEDVLKSLEDGARSAIEAVRKFLDTVDRTLPPRSESHSKREEIADSALEMAERLVHTQYEFLRKVIDGAGKSVKGSRSEK
ncbi:MAG: hypothetical protein ACXVH1_17220 [Solirubrobacteraceae bacterium]